MPGPQTLRYAVSDYFERPVAAGTVTVGAGERSAAARLPSLAPGAYRVRVTLGGATLTSSFARLPERTPVRGPANRFGVTVSSPWLVPPSRLDEMAAAFRRMGAGYVRDEVDWRAIEPRRGAYDTRGVDRFARGYRAGGLKTLAALWALPGNLAAPDWARTKASDPMPDDLRDGYRMARHLAGRSDGVGEDAIEVWNEPDVDVIDLGATAKADRHAAYVKAATLGITDRARRPLAALSGIAYPGEFQSLMLQNGVADYADVWAFHGYAEEAVPGRPSPPPAQLAAERELRRLYGATRLQSWMTEAGIFLRKAQSTPTPAQQADQARYLVQSAVHALASGVDKHFWFSGPPYGSCPSDWGCFGLFGEDFRPWASYSAHAAMASLLGEARFAGRPAGLPTGASSALFRDGRRAIAVLWADTPTPVDVALPGEDAVALHDIMGARRGTLDRRDGRVRVVASPNPVYLVSADGGRRLRARPPADDERRARHGRLSAARHIVLDQRFGSAAEPGPVPPFGYRLGVRTRMHLAVYNLDDRARTVRVAAHAFAGWQATPMAPTRVRLAPHGRALIPFVIRTGARVRRGVDYPLVFEARLADGGRVPPSVARIVRTGPRGRPLALAPSITGATIRAGVLRATIRDTVSGIDPQRVHVELDGRRIDTHFDRATGRLTARLPQRLLRDRHDLWIRAANRAHARASKTLTVPGVGPRRP